MGPRKERPLVAAGKGEGALGATLATEMPTAKRDGEGHRRCHYECS